MKILKNTTISPIFLADCGLTLPASSSYTTTPHEWATLSSSTQITPYITNGSIIINDNWDDLKPQQGVQHINGGISRDSNLDLTLITTTTFTGNYSLYTGDRKFHCFRGTATGMVIILPDARTLTKGVGFLLQNESTQGIWIKRNDGTTELLSLNPQYRVIYFLEDNSTQGGIWLRAPESTAALSGTAPVLSYYGGNANVGRYLEIFPGTDSFTVPFLIVVNQRLVAMSLSLSAASASTIGVFKMTDLVNPVATISTTAIQISNSDITLGAPLYLGEKIAVRVTAGAPNKPSLAMYLST